MIKKTTYFALAFFVLLGCNVAENNQLKGENEKLKSRLDSLQRFNSTISTTMSAIDALLDSIESSEKIITLNLEKGTNYQDHAKRLRNINEYTRQMEVKLADMETKLASNNTKNKLYNRMIKDLREQLDKKQQFIGELTKRLETFEMENEALLKTVDMQNQAIEKRELQVKIGKQELNKLENKITNILKEARAAEALAYFKQAEQAEQLAKKTKLAPKKKRQHYRNAYQLYKKSFETGSTKAYEKMLELEDKIK